MDETRFVLNDLVWKRLAPLLPGKASDSGVTVGDNRPFWGRCSGGFAPGCMARSSREIWTLEQPVSLFPTLG